MKISHIQLTATAAIMAALCLMPGGAASAGETAQTLANTELKGEPFVDAATVASLPAGSSVEIIKRQGGWMKVKPASGEGGWLKMTSVKLGGGDAAGKSGDSGLGSLLNVARSGRSGNTGVTVATGVRGLTPEDLKNAKPAPEAVKKLDSFAAAKGDAESFASKASLRRQTVDYVAEAKVASESTPSGGTFGGGRK
jgi:hypothetical protein